MANSYFAFCAFNAHASSSDSFLTVTFIDPKKDAEQLKKVIRESHGVSELPRFADKMVLARSAQIGEGERAYMPRVGLGASLLRFAAEVAADRSMSVEFRQDLSASLQRSIVALESERYLVAPGSPPFKALGRISERQATSLVAVQREAARDARTYASDSTLTGFFPLKSGAELRLQAAPCEGVQMILAVEHAGPCAFRIDHHAGLSDGKRQLLGGFNLILKMPPEPAARSSAGA